jgi:hypothetical protein
MDRHDVKAALNHMYGAREILFNQLRNPETLCREVAEGLDCLFRAIEIAEKPEESFQICTHCDSIAFELLEDGRLVCLSCDSEWSELQAKEARR